MSAKTQGHLSLLKYILPPPLPIPHPMFPPCIPGATLPIAPVIVVVKRSKLPCKFLGNSYVFITDGMMFMAPRPRRIPLGVAAHRLLQEKPEGRTFSASLGLYK